MLDIFSRHRPLALLASVVLAQILLLAFQIKRDRDIRLIRYWAVAIMSPVERAGTWSTSRTKGLWTGYIDLHNARSENNRLRAEAGALRLRNEELESQSLESRRLAALWNFHETHSEVQMMAAQVIGASADPTSHTLFVDRGSRDHLRNNLAVVSPDGIVGKIVEVFPSASQVLLINDKESGVGALFAESRTHGVVKGSGDPEPRMDYVVNDEKVKTGEMILTSGDDRIFPKGLLIGSVIDSKPAMPFQLIHVQPAARLDRLEDVIILLSQQEFDPKKDSDVSSSFSLVPAPPADAIVQLGAQTSLAPASTQSNTSPRTSTPAAQTSAAATTTKPGTTAAPQRSLSAPAVSAVPKSSSLRR